MVRKKRILIILNCVILTLHSVLIILVTTFPVFALSAGGIQTTIASIIVSLMLQTGVAPVNNAWLQSLNASYGVESSIGTIADAIDSGLLTETTSGLIDTGLSEAIASQAAYTDLGLDELFTTTANDVGVVAGSGAVNLTNTAINCGTAGTIGAFAGAVGVGVGIGVLINHVREQFGKYITSQASLQTEKVIMDNVTVNDGFFLRNYNGKYYDIYKDNINNVIGLYYVNHNNNGYNVTWREVVKQSVTVDTYEYNANRWVRRVNGGYYGGNSNYFQTEEELDNVKANLINFTEVNYSDYDNYVNRWKAGEIDTTRRESPDLTGSEGYQDGVLDENGNYIFPQIENQIPEGYDMKPVDMNDYNNYVDDVNQDPALIPSFFQNMIDNILVEPSIIPDQGIDIPTIPDRPVIPPQPDQPSKDPITDQEQAVINSGLAETGLANVFPFCIPFDLFALVGSLKAGREAPVIVFEFPEQFGWGGIEIDLSAYDEAAQILRHMELLLFIIGLAVHTRSLIGAVG